MGEDVVRWILVDQPMTADQAVSRVAAIFGIEPGDGCVRCPALVVTPASRQQALGSGLAPSVLAPWQTFLRLTPTPGIDEWSYDEAVRRLRQGLLDASLREAALWGGPRGARARTAEEVIRRVHGTRVYLDVEFPYDAVTVVPSKPLPFVIGVVGDFAGSRDAGPLAARRFQPIDRDRFDRIQAGIAPPATGEEGPGACWRALRQLAEETNTGPGSTQIEFCPLTKEELRADVMGVSDVRDSWFYRTVCIDTFGEAANRGEPPRVFSAFEPFAVLICDYAFDATDAPLLSRLDEIAAAGLAVMIAAEPPAGSGQAAL